MKSYKYSEDIDWSYHFGSQYNCKDRKKRAGRARKSKSKVKGKAAVEHGRVYSAQRKPLKTSYLYYGAIFLSLFVLLFLISVSFSYASPLKSYENGADREFSSFNSRQILEKELLQSEKRESSEQVEVKGKVSSRISYKKYRVKRNETISHISAKFGLSNDTVILLNRIKHQKSLKAGTILVIPNQNGRLITIGKNDSIFKIANRYGVSWKKIVDVNNIESEVLITGKKLFIPEAGMTAYERKLFYKERESKKVVTKKSPERPKSSNTNSSGFTWPLRGKITSAYGMRRDPFLSIMLFHKGIDIKGDLNEAVKSVKGGKVIYIGWNKIYGNVLMVRHDKQYVSVYAHLNKVLVKNGQQVQGGEVVARVGNTGRSTGAHLHLEIRKNGKTLDPLTFLK